MPTTIENVSGKVTIEGSTIKILDPAIVKSNAKLRAGFAAASKHYSQAFGKEAEESDLLPFEFILCHVGKNSNNDNIPLEELKKKVNAGKVDGVDIFLTSYETPVGEPLDEDHNTAFSAIVGDIIASELVEDPANPEESSYIKCWGVVYRNLFPAVAFKLIRGSEQGYCKISMECEFERSEGTKKSSSGRVLRGINFRGAAFTRFPADHEDPRILTVKASIQKDLAALETPVGMPALPVSPSLTDQERPAVVPDGPTSGATMSALLARQTVATQAKAAVEAREAEMAKADIDLEELKKMVQPNAEELKLMIDNKKEQIARIKGYLMDDLEYLAECLEDLAELEGKGGGEAEAKASKKTKYDAVASKARALQLSIAGDEAKKVSFDNLTTAMAAAVEFAKADADKALQHMQEAMKEIQAEPGAAPAAPAAGAPPKPGEEGKPGAEAPKPGEEGKPASDAPAPAAGAPAAPAAPPHAPAAPVAAPNAAPAPVAAPTAAAPAPVAAPAMAPMSDAELAQAAMNFHAALHGESLDPANIAAQAKTFFSSLQRACMAPAAAPTAPAPVAAPPVAMQAVASEDEAAAKIKADAEYAEKMKAEAAAKEVAELAKAAEEATKAEAALKAAELAKASQEVAKTGSEGSRHGERAGITVAGGKVRIVNLEAALAERAAKASAAPAAPAQTVVPGKVPTSFTLSSRIAIAAEETATEGEGYKKGDLAAASIFGKKK